MVDVPLVLWAFSHPGDLDFDASRQSLPLASLRHLGSNRLAAVIEPSVGSYLAVAVADLGSLAHIDQATVAFGSRIAFTKLGNLIDSDSFGN